MLPTNLPKTGSAYDDVVRLYQILESLDPKNPLLKMVSLGDDGIIYHMRFPMNQAEDFLSAYADALDASIIFAELYSERRNVISIAFLRS